MRRLYVLVLLGWLSGTARSATYYFSSSVGNDGNPCTQTLPCKTFGGAGTNHLNGLALNPGDAVYLNRGDVWNEALIPPASGSSGSPITFDAYGTGAAPLISGYVDLGNNWSIVSSTVRKVQPASLQSANYPGTAGSIATLYLNGVLYQNQKQATSGTIANPGDWASYSGNVYLYAATSTPESTYGPVVGIVMRNQSPITISSRAWLVFQHIAVAWFDGTSTAGVYVTGNSDHLIFANMSVSSQVPFGTTPHGFYVNASSPTSIGFYNVDAHMNFDGFRFDGTAGANAFTLINCSAFGNRDSAIVDNTGTNANYSYSHFYSNGLATGYPNDIQGGTAGLHNPGNPSPGAPSYIDPLLANYALYPARDSFTVDDVGLSAGTEAYINANVLPQFQTHNMHFGAALTAEYAIDWASVQMWQSLGHDISSHSWSHQYWHLNTAPYPTLLNAINLQYVGTGTAATVSVDTATNTLTTNVTGGPGGENLTLSLGTYPYDQVGNVVTSINTTYPGSYSASVYTYSGSNSSMLVRPAAHTVGLAAVSGQDIKTGPYVLQFDKALMVRDEMTSSLALIRANISNPGQMVYVYPDGQEDNATDAILAGIPAYAGGRGTLTMMGAFNSVPASVGTNEVYAQGIDALGFQSYGIASFHGYTAAQIDGFIQALLFRQKLWGYPVGIFIHNSELTATEVGYVLDALANHGATVMRNSDLIAWLNAQPVASVTGTPGQPGAYRTAPPSGGPFAPTRLPTSPDVGAGQNLAFLGTSFEYDLNGIHRSGNWDIGAYQMPQAKLQGAQLAGAASLR
jgi:hypothetical protein